jgi:hypothetical protein
VNGAVFEGASSFVCGLWQCLASLHVSPLIREATPHQVLRRAADQDRTGNISLEGWTSRTSPNEHEPLWQVRAFREWRRIALNVGVRGISRDKPRKPQPLSEYAIRLWANAEDKLLVDA